MPHNMSKNNLGKCAQCNKNAVVTRREDNLPLCWDCVMELARVGKLSISMAMPRKTRYDPKALRDAIDQCDANVLMFEEGIKKERGRKIELLDLLQEATSG